MCMSGDTQQPDPAPPPPAPPPVLEQSAPQTSAPKQSDQLANAAAGTKKYRSGGLAIDGSGASGSGLSIPQ